MAWLSELSARAVSVLEDVDHLAAESLNPHSTPGSRYTPRRKISRNTTPLPLCLMYRRMRTICRANKPGCC